MLTGTESREGFIHMGVPCCNTGLITLNVTPPGNIASTPLAWLLEALRKPWPKLREVEMQELLQQAVEAGLHTLGEGHARVDRLYICDGPQTLPANYVLQEDPEDIPFTQKRRHTREGHHITEKLGGHSSKAQTDSRRHKRTSLPDSSGVVGNPKAIGPGGRMDLSEVTCEQLS